MPDVALAERQRSSSRSAADRLNEAVGQRIRASRIAAGLSATAVADQLHCMPKLIEQIEAGTIRALPAQIFELAACLKVPIASFYAHPALSRLAPPPSLRLEREWQG